MRTIAAIDLMSLDVTKRVIQLAQPDNLHALMGNALTIILCVTKWLIAQTNPMNRCIVMWTSVPRLNFTNAVTSASILLPATIVIVIKDTSKCGLFSCITLDDRFI